MFVCFKHVTRAIPLVRPGGNNTDAAVHIGTIVTVQWQRSRSIFQDQHIFGENDIHGTKQANK